MNKIALKFLVGLVALSLAVCAAFFSVTGLCKLFAGAATAVIVMASTLEASKLVLASFLYQSWSTVSKTLRAYLLIAIAIIAMITSIGIYGFLSSAYQKTKSKFDLTQTTTDSLNTQKQYYESTIKTVQLQLNAKNTQLTNLTSIRTSQENRATQLTATNRSTRYADRSARETDLSIKLVNKEIDSLNKKIISYTDSVGRLTIAAKQVGLKNELSSELGSLVYISQTLNVSMDKVVNILILLFIIVFDPLAICMVLAFNFLNKKSEDTIIPKELKEEVVIIKETPKEPIKSPTKPPRKQPVQDNSIISNPHDRQDSKNKSLSAFEKRKKEKEEEKRMIKNY